jgi:hypothetical protein
MEKNSSTDEMRTLSDCISKLVKNGYTENFQVTDHGLSSADNDKEYTPEKVHINNFYRFEGASDPDDSSILYAIETNDGVKGTLSDAYGIYADPRVGKFIKEVEDISKVTEKKEPGPQDN